MVTCHEMKEILTVETRRTLITNLIYIREELLTNRIATNERIIRSPINRKESSAQLEEHSQITRKIFYAWSIISMLL